MNGIEKRYCILDSLTHVSLYLFSELGFWIESLNHAAEPILFLFFDIGCVWMHPVCHCFEYSIRNGIFVWVRLLTWYFEFLGIHCRGGFLEIEK